MLAAWVPFSAVATTPSLEVSPASCFRSGTRRMLHIPIRTSCATTQQLICCLTTGNMDRHHYETFEKFGNDTFLLHLDNGRG